MTLPRTLSSAARSSRADRSPLPLATAAAVLLVVLAALGGVAIPTSASAGSAGVGLAGAGLAGTVSAGDVQVSPDGVHFASGLSAGLFDTYGALIPKGSMRASLWIRNPSDQPAVVRVSLRSVEGASAGLNDYLTLRVTTPADPTAPALSLGTAAACAVLAPVQTLAAGATLRTDITIAMADVTGLTAQHESADLGILVSLRNSAAGAFSASACADDGVLVAVLGTPPAAERPAALPGTGFNLPIDALVGGGLMLGLGALLVRLSRRERKVP